MKVKKLIVFGMTMMAILVSCERHPSFSSSEEALQGCKQQLELLKQKQDASIEDLSYLTSTWLEVRDSAYSSFGRDSSLNLKSPMAVAYFMVSDSIRAEITRLAFVKPRSLREVMYFKQNTAMQRKVLKKNAIFIQTMIANLESKKNRLLEEVEQLKRDRDSGKISAEEAKIRLDRIQKELEEVDEKIADKTQKLHTAELQLAQLQTKTLSAERKFEEVQKKLQKEVPLLSKATVKEMQQMGYMMMATDAKHRIAKYHEFLSSLPFEQRQVARQTGDILFDGSIAETIMDNAVQVTSIAAALYLGYLDAATKISQSGGGGGGPGTGWGKRDDEDDLAFRQRCFFMALHMMRPSQKVQRKR